jgi:hypothetical protein
VFFRKVSKVKKRKRFTRTILNCWFSFQNFGTKRFRETSVRMISNQILEIFDNGKKGKKVGQLVVIKFLRLNYFEP